MLQVRPWLPAGTRTVNRLIPTQTHQRGHTQDQLDRAVDRLEQLGTPAALTEYLSLLKACNRTKSLSQAKRIHAHLAHHGLDLTGFLGENLLVTLARCGALVDALHFFHSLPCRTVFAWTALISGFIDCGRAREALMMYQCMLEDGVEPDTYTFVSLFKACGNIRDLEQGKKLHADARGKGVTWDVFVGNTLVSMYGKCGAIVEAENVFAELSQRDIVSCNAMISVYVEQGQVEKALLLYRQMHEEALNPPDEHTVMFALQAIRVFAEKEEAYFVNGPSPTVMSFEIGQTLHAYARRKGFSSNTFVGNTLVSMYGNCGTIAHALNVFYGLSQPDIVSWTAMLSAFVEQGQAEKALQLYRELPQEDMNSNHQTFLVALQACSHLAEKEETIMLEGQLSKPKSLEIGRAVHADARAKGLDTSLFVGNTLVSMYGKCGAILEAENVFAGLLHLDIVSWNAMLSAYVEQGQAEKALQVYRQMREENMSPNRQTFMTVLQACDDMAETEEAYAGEGHSTKVISFEIGQALHADAWRRGLASDVFVGTTLVRMYGKCGTILEAENAFGGLSQNDIVSCTAMLSAYVEQGEEEKALLLYRWMQKEGVTLDDVTLVCILQACRKTGRVEMGRQLHFFIISGGLDLNSFVGSSLIHVYGSFANMGDARAVFDGLPLPDVAAWNACIAGSAGAGNTSLQMFEEMQVESFRPDGLTFASVLSACSHAGLVDKGVGYFESMSRDHCLIKDVNHFVLMVDLLGRAGDFARVQKVMDRVPKQADLATWLCLLGACRSHGNVELAKFAFDHVVNMQTKDAAAYVLMSNICVDAGLYEREEELGDIGSWGCCTCLDAKTSLPPTSLL